MEFICRECGKREERSVKSRRIHCEKCRARISRQWANHNITSAVLARVSV